MTQRIVLFAQPEGLTIGREEEVKFYQKIIRIFRNEGISSFLGYFFDLVENTDHSVLNELSSGEFFFKIIFRLTNSDNVI